jgi:hypothetical protein
MKNNLFNLAQMKEYAESKAFDLTVSKFDFIKKHVEMVENREFESEESSYLYFYDFLKNVFGYSREDNIKFEDKIGRGRVEFALQSDDNKFMIIELKDQKTSLDKPQTRVNDKRTPIDQAFDYAQDSDIDWMLVSNFREFRLYNYNERSKKCICFSYEDLLDKEKFRLFMIAFSKKSHVEYNYPDKLLEKTLVIEKDLEKNFYKLFHETRLMLITELELMNNLNREDSIHHAQIILNRYMFISFAEDTGLISSQISTDTIKTPIERGDLRDYTLWQRLNELFIDINKGNRHKEIPEYNGGLFEEDLSYLKIRDIVEDQSIFQDTYQDWEYEKEIEQLPGNVGDKLNPIYQNMLTISSYDFSSQLDVNILGHIFENSIGDIEELKEDTKGRRKKEGIFYTPDYITDYICRNTIIPYLSKSGNLDNVTDLIEEYSWSRNIEDLDEKLKNIKIVDPACGSGAFLNKATDVLLEIHEAIYDIKKGYTKSTGMRVGKGRGRRTESVQHTDLGAYVFDHIEKRREILLNNIYGVDLNEESVEITKLSLFLKVCRKDLKLPNLDENIKNGNSLIEDLEFTDKPFKWEAKFPEIFKKGRFDIVIGNPPYVRQEKIKEIKHYLKENYEVYTGKSDLYSYFFEIGLKILNKKGYLGFISSNKFIKANYGKKLRKYILENSTFKIYVDHSFDSIFADATTYPSIFVLIKDHRNQNRILVDNKFEIKQSQLNSDDWIFQDPKITKIRKKIESKGTKIIDLNSVNIHYGIKTGYNKAFIIDKKTKNELITEDMKNKEIIKPLIRGRDLKKWAINFKDYYLLFIDWEFNIDNYPSLKNYLLNFKDNLEKRSVVTKGSVKWFALSSYGSTYYKKFETPKLIYPVIAPYLFAVYDEDKFFINDKCFIITSDDMNLKYLGTLLSSSTLNFIFTLLSSSLQGNYYELRKIYIEKLPIYPATTVQQQPFIEKADQMLELNCQLQEEVNGFKHWIQKEFNIEKLSQKLEKYYELDNAEEFIREMKKKKINTTSRKTREYLEQEFNESLAIIRPLYNEVFVFFILKIIITSKTVQPINIIIKVKSINFQYPKNSCSQLFNSSTSDFKETCSCSI